MTEFTCKAHTGITVKKCLDCRIEKYLSDKAREVK